MKNDTESVAKIITMCIVATIMLLVLATMT